MSHPIPSFKLEISIVSAQDLAPVSKLLRTYAVAWVHPDQKLTTRVDHHGNTHPTWNYRFVFHIEDKFLNSDSSAITIEIYNVSWLRDIPIGTVQVLISNIIPPSLRSQSSSTMRFVALPIRRPSGTLHGVLNLGVNLIDCTRRSIPVESELSASTASHKDLIDQNISPKRNYENEGKENKTTATRPNNPKIMKLRRSGSERTVSFKDETRSKPGSVFGSSTFDGWRIGKSPKPKATAPSVSSYNIRPLPSEVAASMAKGLYSSHIDDVGSSVLENWTVLGGNEEVTRTGKAVRWKGDEVTPTSKLNPVKKRSNGGGLLSCFGIVCGYECNIVCGVPKTKKKNKKTYGEANAYIKHSADNLRLSYR